MYLESIIWRWILSNLTLDKIRDIAFQYFLDRGYEASNIRDICNKVNIKPSSLYFYYKSKEELFFNLYDDIWNDKIEKIKVIMREQEYTPAINPLKEYFKNILDYYMCDIVKFKFLLRYHMFTPEEIALTLKEKHKKWVDEEGVLIQQIISDCRMRGLLKNNRALQEYINEYNRFENTQLYHIIISNIKPSAVDLEQRWIKFWNMNMDE